MTTENVSLNASFGNQTLHEQFGQLRHLSIMGYAILMSVSGVENITILFLLSVRRPMSRITLLLISLTVSDLLVTFLTMPLEIAWAYTVQWLAEDWVCKVMMVGRIFGLYSSSFNLVAISIDRFCIILYPFTNMTNANARVRWMLVLVWSLSTVCSLPQAMVFQKLYHPDYPSFGQCMNDGRTPHFMVYQLFVTLMLFVIPLMLFCIFYGRLWFFIRKRHLMTSRPADPAEVHCTTHVQTSRRNKWRSRKEPSMNGTADYNLGQSMRYTNAPSIYTRAKSKSSKLAVTLVIVFLVCWVPYYLVSKGIPRILQAVRGVASYAWGLYICAVVSNESFLYWFDEEAFQKHLDPRVRAILFIFAVSQSCLNPIVTGVFSLRIDRKLARLYCCRKTIRRLRRVPTNDRNGNYVLTPAIPPSSIPNRLSLRRNQMDQAQFV